MEGHEKIKDECRLCSQMPDKMVSVFDKTEEGKQIIHLIKDCLPIIIYRSDPFSKKICEKCLENLNSLSKFKQISQKTDEKHKAELQINNEKRNKEEILYLSLENTMDTNDTNDGFEMTGMLDVCTSTEDLPVLCVGCKQAVLDASTINGEIELCEDLQKVVTDALLKRKPVINIESEKVLRSRRRKPQPFYHELDDSLCSSMSEFTQNTESSQFPDYQSDVDSIDSETCGRPSKRRKIEFETRKDVSGGGVLMIKKSKRKFIDDDLDPEEEVDIEFKAEVEYRYNPLSLLQLTLNVINKENMPDYTPDDFYIEVYEPECAYCKQKFQNLKILALHEVCHMDVEIEEKIDNPALWPTSRGEDAEIRNKWLSYFDEHGYEEDDICLNSEQSLLIPINMDEMRDDEEHQGELVTLQGTKPVVNGVPLGDFSKEERKNFYQSLVVGGVKKRFCQICRYSFKDNWAIESHYFSSACYYTCKYCGMRFNKQRHRFDEHIQEHVYRGDPVVSDKIYAPSKVNNYMPKVIHPDKAKKSHQAPQQVPEKQEQQPVLKVERESPQPPDDLKVQPLKMKNLINRKSLQPNLQPKEESKTEIITSQSKTGNQAYFCRKCYKVFFKLDEFNIHSKNCDYNQFPAFIASKPPPSFNSKPTPPPQPPQQQQHPQKNGDTVKSNAMGRPVRSCARDVGPYKDEAYIPEIFLKDHPPRQTQMQGPPFVCFICNTPFPTVYSRNSHMRIHKGDTHPPSTSKPKPMNHFMSNVNNSNYEQMNYQHFIDESIIKQEPLEPEVQIHESDASPINTLGGGAVSLTPIPKKNNQRPTINPSIYKLVQDNPNISIKRSPEKYNSPMPSGSQMGNAPHMSDPDKSYKCSSCWEAFANKSHLYFHKKNQCEGSRFPCPFCKKRFGTEAAYSSHIFYSHPE